jgi:hypothetical protein
MSRHTIPTNTKDVTLCVGYDRPLNHFFATAFPKNGDPIELTPLFGGVQTIDELASLVKPFAKITADVEAMLEAERCGFAETNRIVDHRPKS